MAKVRPSSSSPSSSSIKDKAFAGVGNLLKLLPTGTFFLFQFLNPVLTNNGHCNIINKYLTVALIVVCAFSCCFSCFTDSYRTPDGIVHYGIATATGLWPSSGDASIDYSAYRLGFGDFVHAFFTLMVFAVVSLLDPNTVRCLYPEFGSAGNLLLMVLPPVIGVVSSAVFACFPSKRHGIGYPPDPDDDRQTY